MMRTVIFISVLIIVEKISDIFIEDLIGAIALGVVIFYFIICDTLELKAYIRKSK